MPAGAWAHPPDASPGERLKSYRQGKTGGPAPLVVVEVPSDSDGFVGLLDQVGRCVRLGAVVHIVSTSGQRSILRFEADPDAEFVDPSSAEQWLDRPVPELGGITIGFDGIDLVVTLPDGTAPTSDEALLAEAMRRADDSHRRVDALAARLRALGVDPDG